MRPDPVSGPVLAWPVDAVLVASVLPLLAKAVDYALIGGYVPLLAFLLGATLVATAIATTSPRLRKAAIACWGVLLVLWALARLAMFVLHLVLGVPEAHVAGQFTPVYVVVSAAFLFAGVYLFRRRKTAPRRPASPPQAIAGSRLP